jgi:hypothetical protein
VPPTFDDPDDLEDHVKVKPLIRSISTHGGKQVIPPVLCVGNLNTDRKPAFPRMHHKFMIFIKEDHPSCVWTGSFNMTYNGNGSGTVAPTNSLENAVVIKHIDAVNAYINEWACLLTISEELNWDNHWTPTSFRFGT